MSSTRRARAAAQPGEPAILATIDRAARALEESPVSPGRWLLAFAAIVGARNLLEVTIGQNPVYFPEQFFLHYPLAYVAPMLALVLVLHAFSGTPLRRVTNLMLYVWSLTLLPPIVDLVLGRGSEGIGYLQLQFREPGEIFLQFFDPRVQFGGTTTGIRVEAAIACLLGAAYVVLRCRRPAWQVALRALGAALAVYVTALGFFTLPRLAAAALAPFLSAGDTAAMYAQGSLVRVSPPVDVRVGDRISLAYLVPLCLSLGGFWLWRVDAAGLRRLLRGLPRLTPLRGAVLAGIGMAYGWLARTQLDGAVPEPAPVDVLAGGAVILASALVVAGGRLLASPRARDNAGPRARAAGLVLSAAGLILAGVAGFQAPTLLLVALTLIWIRYRPPLHLERLWVLGPVALALQGLALVGAGTAWALQKDALAALSPPLLRGVLLALALTGIGNQVCRRSPVTWPELRWSDRVREHVIVVAWLAAAAAVPVVMGTGVVVVSICVACVLAAALPRLLGAAVPWLEQFGLIAALGIGATGALADPATRSAVVEAGIQRPKLVVRQGMQFEADGSLEAAAATYRRALEMDPELSRVWTRLGEIEFKSGNKDAARQALRRGAELDPHDVPSRQQLGMLLLEENRIAEAVIFLGEAAELAPRHPVVALSLAEALTRLEGGRQRAVAAWERYLDVSEGVPGEDPFRARARTALAELRARPEPDGTGPGT